MSDLLARHDVVLADLDGTLYRGRAAVPGAAAVVREAARRGTRTAYVTNNASRRPAQVSAHLTELGFPARAADVVTSAQAAARLLAGHLEPRAAVVVVGTEALVEEVEAVGLRTSRAADAAEAVVQGHDPCTAWPLLAEAALALRAGVPWVACNLDATLPTERGLLPGNGAMVAALSAATGRTPEVAGKPAPALLQEVVARTGARRPLVVGDRLDTDIAAGRAAGFPSLLVLTGVCGAAELLTAAPDRRPDFVGADIGALTAPAASLRMAARPGWAVDVMEPGALRVAATSDRSEELDALRAICAAHWATGGGPARVEPVDDAAAHALDALGLSRPDGSGSSSAPTVRFGVAGPTSTNPARAGSAPHTRPAPR